ncbi:MAG TPA: hypothetical protein ENG09_06635 [Candidatus Syntrophoarchaeum butanivorans]|uniref:2-phosphosulfolactate phosphatase n=1 Tax=Candidatus Syntropharchaeum butanivorans TaxID=1839936 RepID=A0A7C1B4F8_9EURY|nr:MAG: hypothetical protein CW694_05505 [Candidatus Syntrophoarchaeum sp. WYZ-LMO15]HDM36899.1 hypothetical protein [Candidatus Syntrophoarchaeum butanivorans]
MRDTRIVWDDEELEAAAITGTPIIMIDTLRATSTIVTALARGAREVRVVLDYDPGAEKGWLRIGERHGIRLEGADCDNSPVAVSRLDLSGVGILLRTTNFSRAFAIAKDTTVYAGSYLNISRCIDLASSLRPCLIYPCRRMGRVALEDVLAALIIRSGEIPPEDDLLELVKMAESARNLISLGKLEDIEFSCRINRFDILPISGPGDSSFRAK